MAGEGTKQKCLAAALAAGFVIAVTSAHAASGLGLTVHSAASQAGRKIVGCGQMPGAAIGRLRPRSPLHSLPVASPASLLFVGSGVRVTGRRTHRGRGVLIARAPEVHGFLDGPRFRS